MGYFLNAKLRTVVGKQVKTLRKRGLIPAVVYGKGMKNINVEVSAGDFEKLYLQVGQSTIVDLTTGDQKPSKVLITDVHRHPLTEQISHIDLYQVDMSEKMKAKVPLVFVGESKAVKELGAVLTKTLQEMEVECLPQDLPHQIEVSLGSLVDFGDIIRVSDISLPANVKIHEKPETAVATVEAMKEEKVEDVSKDAEQAAISDLKTEQAEKKEEKITQENVEQETKKT